MRSVNMVVLIGHLTRDPEMRQTTTGKSVATFSIATNRTWTTADGERQEQTDFHDLVAWGKLAEICDQYLSKGTAIYVRGRLQTRNWEAQDGTKRYKTEIVVDDLNILSPRKQGDSNSFEVDLGSTAPKTEENLTTSKAADSGSEEINVEDIPF
ncbi:MAG: hypothetical protein A2788_02475 [Candidatus Abawacabacteria bacterium RIFCSPHIGHO2_01_FULL_46_8]|uniref:Single-stranded DNA-binding protein n=1 Tax=Candidatus Abawacabacteria bacterium RIFCSPHIGHO2_01_FULL_46_8 TaxID=1817815 RepID=A0A1F4XM08_9BACT|nr:MAG: hypothetical protein A2788_02475 [Candidatus Abawacabacteria bacterium RIFCSPHIGHO2_01_FULL_46_8]